MEDDNFFSKLSRYYHTIKYLRPIQLYGQLILRTKRTKPNWSPPPKLRITQSPWITPILKAPQDGAPNKFVFLNQEKDISDETIWSDERMNKLWLYNLHYFDVLNASQESISHWQYDLILRWIRENPPVKGIGWEPYPLSLRIVNWIKWLLVNNRADSSLLHNLTIQVRYLYKRVEIHLLGNHVLANAKALLFAGLFFTGKEADAWFRKGLKLFHSELNEQVLTDGGHFELSTMYHALILEDLLDVLNLFKTYARSIPENCLMIKNKMFYWLETMCHLDGDIAFFNDATLGIAPRLSQLKKYQNRLNFNNEVHSLPSVTHLTHSGYCRFQRGNALLIADVAQVGARYQPGHAHADTLSFEFSIGRQRLIVHSGISTYAESKERLRQRGTQAHNSVTINHHNSSELWKSFRVARRANVYNVKLQTSANVLMLKASHDGYHQRYQILHTRTWSMTDKELVIQDTIAGSGKHHVELNFHVHPKVNLKEENNCILFYDELQQQIAKLQTTHVIKLVDTSFHPGFNLAIPNKKIVIAGQYQLPMEFEVKIKWNE